MDYKLLKSQFERAFGVGIIESMTENILRNCPDARKKPQPNQRLSLFKCVGKKDGKLIFEDLSKK